jgi:hypothetical protein
VPFPSVALKEERKDIKGGTEGRTDGKKEKKKEKNDGRRKDG